MIKVYSKSVTLRVITAEEEAAILAKLGTLPDTTITLTGTWQSMEMARYLDAVEDAWGWAAYAGWYGGIAVQVEDGMRRALKEEFERLFVDL